MELMPEIERPSRASGRTRTRATVEKQLLYPKLKDLFDRRWHDLVGPIGATNLKDVATKLQSEFRESNISSRLRSYRYGARRPKPEEIEKVAGWFFNASWKRDASAHAHFSRELATAIGYGPQGLAPSVAHYSLKDFRTRRPLRVGGVPYGAFCNPTGMLGAKDMGFVDGLFERFVRFSSLTVEDERVAPTDLAHAIERLATADLHLVLSILATADRLMDLEFFAFPIRIGLNAVILKCHEEHRSSVIKALSARIDKRLRDHQKPNLVPVILPMEVGGIYVEKGLGWDHNCKRVNKLVESQYCDMMLAADRDGDVGVAVADEVSCLKIMGYLDKNNIDASLVFDLSGSRNLRNQRLPQYLLAIGAHVDAKELTRHIREAFQLYVDADEEAVIHDYLGLLGQLASDVRLIVRDDSKAVKWALHQLRLNANDYFPSNCIFPDSLRYEVADKLKECVADRKANPTEGLESWIIDALDDIPPYGSSPNKRSPITDGLVASKTE
jgi:hypothetical protein